MLLNYNTLAGVYSYVATTCTAMYRHLSQAIRTRVANVHNMTFISSNDVFLSGYKFKFKST